MPHQPDLAKREAWSRRLRDFDRDGSTVADFCRRLGVSVWSFYYWRKNLQSRNGSMQPNRPRMSTVTSSRHAATKPTVNFVPVEITGHSNIEVHLPDGTRLSVPCHDRAVIDAVIAALRSEPREGQPC